MMKATIGVLGNKARLWRAMAPRIVIARAKVQAAQERLDQLLQEEEEKRMDMVRAREAAGYAAMPGAPRRTKAEAYAARRKREDPDFWR